MISKNMNLNEIKKLEESKKLLDNVKNAEYISELCRNAPDITLNTQCGVGKYSFVKIAYKDGQLVIEFKLVVDDRFQDSQKILYNIGDKCFLTAPQFIYIYRYLAEA